MGRHYRYLDPRECYHRLRLIYPSTEVAEQDESIAFSDDQAGLVVDLSDLRLNALRALGGVLDVIWSVETVPLSTQLDAGTLTSAR